jgi:hypothetical protein
MRHATPFLLGALMCLIVFVAGPLRAEWLEKGIFVCDYFNAQMTARVVSDGAGGVIVAWRDYRNINYDIYAQRIDAYGNRLWTADGVPVCTSTGENATIVMIPDGAGGAIIAWEDDRDGDYDIYAQKVDADGTTLWDTDGVALCSSDWSQVNPVIVSDGEGGAMVAWEDYRSGMRYDIYAQRISAAGSVLWQVDGRYVIVEIYDQTDLAICEDGRGGFYVAFQDARNINPDIYAQRVRSDGSTYWGGTGAPLCTDSNSQIDPIIMSDGMGGFMCAWVDYRSGYADVFAQRISDSGTYIWTTDGEPICTANGNQYGLAMTSDGSYGAIIAWVDGRMGLEDIYAQRIDVMGTTQWTGNGIPVCSEDMDQDEVCMTSDGVGGAIIIWRDYRYFGSYDVFAQRLSGSGTPLWTAGGVPLCVEVGEQLNLDCATDMSNGAIVVFDDYRSEADISAQRIERNGYWGYPAPSIASARDIPGDQGGSVQLAWDASRLDIYPDNHISNYTVWRAIDELSAMTAAERGAALVKGVDGYIEYEESIERSTGLTLEGLAPILPLIPEGGLEHDIPTIRTEFLAGESYYWELIMTIEASDYSDTYAEQIPTLFDSTASSAEYHYFQVIAHESNPTGFWVSAVDSGYSVDNLAPYPPVGVAAEQMFLSGGIEITWEPNTEADFDAYVIHRGDGPDFVPDEGNLVYRDCDELYTDKEWRWDSGYLYKLAAIDVHGNVSGYVPIGLEMVTDAESPEIPAASYLSQNYPNPFNPVTRIAFGLKERSPMSLRIYDAAGRLVRVLVEEPRDAGRYVEEWNGRDNEGRIAQSGVYFYKLDAGAFEETKKMVLLR